MKSFLWKIYISRFLDAANLIGVIFALYFSYKGLNPFEISILIAVWSLTTILTEVPFGVLADTFSRRILLIIGLVLKAIGFGFWMMGGFFNYAIGFIFWGMKNTLTSGTLESLVYDELAHYNKKELYEEVSGKMGAYFSLGLVFSAVVGGFVAQISFDWVLIASIVSALLAAVILSTLKSVKPVESTGEVKFYQTIKDAILEIKRNPTLLYVIAFICIIFSAFGATDEYWALIYEDFGLNPTTIGILVALVYGLGSIAGYTVKYFNKSSKSLGYVLIILGALFFLLLGVINTVYLLPLAFIAIYLFQIASIKLEAQMQHNIASEQRATISSLKSLSFELIYMAFVLSFGFVGTKLGVISILPFTAIIILVGILFFYLIKPKSVD